MTAYTVGTQAQALFPDGQNQAFAITNDGPWTVLIDDKSSIGAGSYALPPLSTIAWERRRALWIKARPAPFVNSGVVDNNTALGYINSTVRITGNTDAVNADRAQATIKLSDVSTNKLNAQDLSAAAIETESLSTLTIKYRVVKQANYVATGDNPPTTDYMLTKILWCSRDGEITYQDLFIHPLQDSSKPLAQRLITPIRDSYAIIQIGSQSNTAYHLEYAAYAQMRELPEQFNYWINENVTGPVPIYPSFPAAPRQTSDTATVSPWWNAAAATDLWLSPIKPRVSVNLAITATTVAGVLTIEDPFTGFVHTSIALPVTAGTANFLLNTDFVPIGSPLRLRSTAATGTGKLFIIWQD